MAQGFLTINPTAARQLAQRGAMISVAQVTERVAVTARILAPGSMKTHIRPIVSATAGGLGIVVCDHPAASFILTGTKPHIIRARKRGKYLKFQVNGGPDIFVGPSPGRFVRHPGTKANNFLFKALEASKF